MNKFNVFERYAGDYDNWFDKHKAEFSVEVNAIRKLLPATGAGIEIGVGTGRFAQALGISSGVEPSAAMRQIAVQRGVSVIDGLAESLPINNECYDYALLVTTLCFLDSVATAFKEVERILRPNGYIIIAFIDKAGTAGKKYARNKGKFYQDAIFYSVAEVQKELKKAGFGHFKIERANLPGDFKNGKESDASFVVLRAQKLADTESVYQY